MFKMMLNAADRMVDKLRLKLSEKDRQIHDLQEEIKHLKQVIVDARMTESRLVATMEEGNQKWNSICSRWRERAEDAEFKVREMQRFIDTLPDGLRGAWSTYLMTKKDKERDDA